MGQGELVSCQQVVHHLSQCFSFGPPVISPSTVLVFFRGLFDKWPTGIFLIDDFSTVTPAISNLNRGKRVAQGKEIA
jgi:hypothetical protein